jgi:dihydroxyacetone kinase-like predicted kinase
MAQLTTTEKNAAKDLTNLRIHEAQFVISMTSTTLPILHEAHRLESAGQARLVLLNALYNQIQGLQPNNLKR